MNLFHLFIHLLIIRVISTYFSFTFYLTDDKTALAPIILTAYNMNSSHRLRPSTARTPDPDAQPDHSSRCSVRPGSKPAVTTKKITNKPMKANSKLAQLPAPPASETGPAARPNTAKAGSGKFRDPAWEWVRFVLFFVLFCFVLFCFDLF